MDAVALEPTEAEINAALDDIPVIDGCVLLLEQLQAEAPKPEPVRLTRQAARRLVIQRLNAEMREGGIPRRDRRRFLFWRGESGRRHFPISDMARALVSQAVTKA